MSTREIGITPKGAKTAGFMIPELDDDSGTRDGVFDRILIFESNDPVPTDLFHDLEKAQRLVLKDGGLPIASSEEPLALGFRVSDYVDRDARSSPLSWRDDQPRNASSRASPASSRPGTPEPPGLPSRRPRRHCHPIPPCVCA